MTLPQWQQVNPKRRRRIGYWVGLPPVLFGAWLTGLNGLGLLFAAIGFWSGQIWWQDWTHQDTDRKWLEMARD